jgi:acyl dehydratase
MTQESLITDEARAMIGMETEPVSGEVTAKDIRRYALSIDDHNPLYSDEEYARNTSYGDIIAPPLFFTVPLIHEVPVSELRTDGIPQQRDNSLNPPLKVTNTMGGGYEIEYLKPLHPGDVITAKTKLVDIYERQGRSGSLVFTVTETTYTDQNGNVCVIARSITITR